MGYDKLSPFFKVSSHFRTAFWFLSFILLLCSIQASAESGPFLNNIDQRIAAQLDNNQSYVNRPAIRQKTNLKRKLHEVFVSASNTIKEKFDRFVRSNDLDLPEFMPLNGGNFQHLVREIDDIVDQTKDELHQGIASDKMEVVSSNAYGESTYDLNLVVAKEIQAYRELIQSDLITFSKATKVKYQKQHSEADGAMNTHLAYLEKTLIEQKKLKGEEGVESRLSFRQYRQGLESSPAEKDCISCGESLPEFEMIKLEDCKHPRNYCRTCLKHYLNAKLYARQEDEYQSHELRQLKCMNLDCPAHVTDNALRWHYTQKRINLLKRRNLLSHPQAQAALLRCPQGKCNAIWMKDAKASSKITQCPDCQTKFCTACDLMNPKGESCDEHKAVRKALLEAEIAMDVLKEMKVIQSCPNCKLPIVRADACADVTCRCGHEFHYKGDFREIAVDEYGHRWEGESENWNDIETKVQGEVQKRLAERIRQENLKSTNDEKEEKSGKDEAKETVEAEVRVEIVDVDSDNDNKETDGGAV